MDTYDNRQRLEKIKLNSFDTQSGKPSARQSGRSKASNRNGPSHRSEYPNDPYMNKQLTISGYLNPNGNNNNDNKIGSSRQEKSKFVELINSSRTSNKKKERSSDSQDNNGNKNGVQKV